jgi:hypothetical protein
VIRKERPRRPANIDIPSDLWSLVQDCWEHDPWLRPSMTDAYSRIVDLLSSLEEARSGRHLPRWARPPIHARLNHTAPGIRHTVDYVASDYIGNDLTHVVQGCR